MALNDTKWKLQILRWAKRTGKPILSIDYVREENVSLTTSVLTDDTIVESTRSSLSFRNP